jgi:hypothetical protein
MWIPVYSIEVTSRDINKKFIVEVSMTNTSSNVDFNSTWLGRVIESGTTGDVKVTVSDFE